jgi:hypothetical protein
MFLMAWFGLVAHRPRLVATSKRRWRSSTSALRIRKNLNQVAHCSFRFRVWSAGGQCAFLDNTPNGCKMHASATARSCSTPVHASARRYRSSVPDLPPGLAPPCSGAPSRSGNGSNRPNAGAWVHRGCRQFRAQAANEDCMIFDRHRHTPPTVSSMPHANEHKLNRCHVVKLGDGMNWQAAHCSTSLV